METIGEQSPEDFGEGRWLTYDQLGRIRGIGRESAVKLVQRERWQRQPGNDRTTRVLVPLEWLKPARRQPEAFREDFREASPEVSRLARLLEAAIATSGERAQADAATIGGLQAAVSSLTDRAAAAENRADRAEQGWEAERSRADEVWALVRQYVAELTSARADVDQARTLAQDAAQDAEDLRRADAARRGLGRLARLRAAWRGE